MRSFAHLTPAYIFHRLADRIYRANHPDHPWLTPDAIVFLSGKLKPDFIGLEYGSGRSTTWFAARVAKLTSVEHNPDWFNRVNEEIKHLGLSNVRYFQFPKPEDKLSLNETVLSPYVHVSNDLDKDSLDFALVDGVVRPACVLRTIPLLKKGGLLIIDDANHYLPCNSKAPNTRSIQEGPLNDDWERVETGLRGWESAWFGNGIKETAVFTKPVD